MKAVVYHGHEDFRLERVPDPELQSEGDVLVRVERAAICGSDLHLWHAQAFTEQGFVVGHEFIGMVEEVGPAVQKVRPGDRVLVACTTGCGTCRSCRAGLQSGCPVTTRGFSVSNVFGFGSALPGGQAEAVRVPFGDANCLLVPEGIEAENALLLTDILPTAAMGTEMAEIAAGDVVVVIGCGPVGALAQRLALLRGAACVIAVDLDEKRLERAAERGCVAVQPTRQDLLQSVLEHTEGRGADCVIEAVGKPDLITQAATVTRPGGRVAVIGVVMEPFAIAWPLFLSRNLTLRTGIVSPQTHWDRLVTLIREGRIDPAEIVTHRLPLERAVDAYRLFAAHDQGALKVVLDPRRPA